MADKQALLIMDVQPGIVDMLPNKADYIERTEKVIEFARGQQIPVIFVVVGFRASLIEISEQNKSFSTIRKDDRRLKNMIEPKSAIKVQPGDTIVTKRRVSAFSGSDLEVILRAKQINHLVLTGIATSGVVLSTLREAADKDFSLSVIADLCADLDEEVNRILLEKIFPRQAEVISSLEWTRAK